MFKTALHFLKYLDWYKFRQLKLTVQLAFGNKLFFYKRTFIPTYHISPYSEYTKKLNNNFVVDVNSYYPPFNLKHFSFNLSCLCHDMILIDTRCHIRYKHQIIREHCWNN